MGSLGLEGAGEGNLPGYGSRKYASVPDAETVYDAGSVQGDPYGFHPAVASAGGAEGSPARRFFLVRGGLRYLRGTGEPFLGYAAADLFWKDVLALTHPEDQPRMCALISLLVDRPGGVGTLQLRLLDARGTWRRVEARVRNVIEGYDGFGLLFADIREPTR